MTFPTLPELLELNEGENCEFKQAAHAYEFDRLAQYLCALSNNGGGFVAFGVTNNRPRQTTGSAAFPQPEDTRRALIEKLKINVDFRLHNDGGKRVLVFAAAPRPVGMFTLHNNTPWTRRGDSLVAMTTDEQHRIFMESGHDFSAETCAKAVFEDLDLEAVENFRKRWAMKSGAQGVAALSPRQLLLDCEALAPGGVTYAALILFGRREALGRLLGNCEVVFEYRSSEASGPAAHRVEFRQGFFAFFDRLWELVNLRNDRQHYQDGPFVFDVPTFDERIVREAVLNAVSHRNYQLAGSVFVRQYATRLLVESPGGFPHGITPENILNRQSPRNRRLADILLRAGLIERSGQGMNLMFERSIRQSKALPSFHGSDAWQVNLTLDGVMQDPKLLVFLNKLGDEALATFGMDDFLCLDAIRRGEKINPETNPNIEKLLELGAIERAGHKKFMLGRKFYAFTNSKGKYTRLRGLDRETNKQLLLKHIRDNADTGSTYQEFEQVLPSFSRNQIQWIIKKLKKQGLIFNVGQKRGNKWYPTI